MTKPYFTPWQGSDYAKHRTVILSESTYDWPVNGDVFSPKPDHAISSVEQAIEEDQHAQYFKRLTQAICECERPTPAQRRDRWNEFAYTIYVQRSVGRGAGVRPRKSLWDEAHDMFPGQLAGIEPKPRKLIITGKDAWNRMPDTHAWLLNDLQAYRFDGGLLWCLALPHPANRLQGFNWQEVGRSIRAFMATSFPTWHDQIS